MGTHYSSWGPLAAALHPQEGNSSNNKQGIEGRRRERKEGGREEQGSERDDEGAVLSHTDWLFLIPGASLSYLCQFYFIYILRPFGGLKYVFIYCVYILKLCSHMHMPAHM